jgi:hypothetical protein
MRLKGGRGRWEKKMGEEKCNKRSARYVTLSYAYLHRLLKRGLYARIVVVAGPYARLAGDILSYLRICSGE